MLDHLEEGAIAVVESALSGLLYDLDSEELVGGQLGAVPPSGALYTTRSRTKSTEIKPRSETWFIGIGGKNI